VIGRLLSRPDFRANPLRAVWRRLWWRVRWAFTSRPLVARLGNGLAIAVVKSASAAPLYYGGWSEPDLAAFLTRTIRPGHVFVDVGAHAGEYTLLAAALGATVHAFEANPALAGLVRANAARNGLPGVTVHACAASDRDGEVRFLVRRDPALSSVGSGRQGDGAEVAARAVRLDGLGLPRVDVMKIDVEGAELAALRGAERLLERDAPVVVFEYAPGNYARFGVAPADVTGFLAERGYRVTTLAGGETWPADAPLVNLVASRRPIT